MLNVLWMMACMGTIIANPDSLPDFVPDHDFFRTFIPMQMFLVWVRLQVNGLIYRDYIETLFGNWKEKKKLRYRETLLKGLGKEEPLYWTYIVLQVMLFLYLTIPLATALWPWLAGRETDVDMWRIIIDVATLVDAVVLVELSEELQPRGSRCPEGGGQSLPERIGVSRLDVIPLTL